MEVQNITERALMELFGSHETNYDVYGGTVRLEERERQVFITVETIYGLYKSLVEETADAWKVVLKSCGYTWGNRLVQRLDKDLTARHAHGLAALNVDSFIDVIQSYFAYHGWGRLTINLDHAENAGIIALHLRDSIVTQALSADTSGPVDFIISGMLRGIFEFIAGRELDCIQITCSRRTTTSQCEFLLSAPQRIATLESLAGQGSLDDAIQKLRAV